MLSPAHHGEILRTSMGGPRALSPGPGEAFESHAITQEARISTPIQAEMQHMPGMSESQESPIWTATHSVTSESSLYVCAGLTASPRMAEEEEEEEEWVRWDGGTEVGFTL
ncbi:hypothetical protein CesoFtcFv8_018880 [Champsocephalus esox]|uniref:Uncharacterized protein n=1 Tax=Champsocephalus esox TaxID=159716 RepID=A0AAN8GMY1_9TELE|nr:hypothetical protein CesoFtcFv8_018880 [Champsocephalus esox]